MEPGDVIITGTPPGVGLGMKAAIIIKAWNAYRLDRELVTLKWQNAGPKKESFPAIEGLQLLETSEAA